MGDGQFKCTRAEAEGILNPCIGRTLGEVDSKDLFFKVDPARNPDFKPKVKGMPGDVVEQSVFGYPPDSKQRPDLLVDGEDVELKTTGLRESKKDGGWEAKEPMSITAVSIDSIAAEKFEESNFWHKLHRMLIVYYHYKVERVAMTIEYRDFPLVGYQFHKFDNDEKETLRNDWQLVHDFIEQAQATLTGTALEDRYSLLGRSLRDKLMMIDTSPKYPNPPRFRLKRAAVTVIARKKFGESRYIALPKAYTSLNAIDEELRRQTAKFQGMTVVEIAKVLGCPSKAKNAAEMVFVRMFGAVGKINDVELFAKAGLQVKTANMIGGKHLAEDTKFIPLDIEALRDPGLKFEESNMYAYFTESQFVFMMFEEQEKGTGRRFIGFKRLVLPEEMVENELRSCFESAHELIATGKLRFVPVVGKDGNVRTNKSGTPMGAPNFPKSSECQIFIKGTGADARSRREYVPGVPMYKQQIWWGKKLTKRLLDSAPWV